jgi:transposase
MVDTMTKTTRADKAAALERWADKVEPGDLASVDTSALRQLAKLAEQREALDDEVTDAVHAARRANRSWSEIGTMLGVSKQAAQRKYGRHVASA